MSKTPFLFTTSANHKLIIAPEDVDALSSILSRAYILRESYPSLFAHTSSPSSDTWAAWSLAPTYSEIYKDFKRSYLLEISMSDAYEKRINSERQSEKSLHSD
jgi:hypothetical protein